MLGSDRLLVDSEPELIAFALEVRSEPERSVGLACGLPRRQGAAVGAVLSRRCDDDRVFAVGQGRSPVVATSAWVRGSARRSPWSVRVVRLSLHLSAVSPARPHRAAPRQQCSEQQRSPDRQRLPREEGRRPGVHAGDAALSLLLDFPATAGPCTPRREQPARADVAALVETATVGLVVCEAVSTLLASLNRRQPGSPSTR